MRPCWTTASASPGICCRVISAWIARSRGSGGGLDGTAARAMHSTPQPRIRFFKIGLLAYVASGQVHLLEQRCETRVCAQHREQERALDPVYGPGALLKGSLQRVHRGVLFAETCVDVRHVVGCDVAEPRALVEALQHSASLVDFSHQRVRVAELCQPDGRVGCQLHRLFQLLHSCGASAALQVDPAEGGPRPRVAWIDCERGTRDCQSFVMPSGAE